MSLTFYDATVPVLARALENLKALLDKAASHVEARSLDAAALTAFRLYPDMFPLTRQVQIATDMAKGAVARLAGVEPERFEDTETTFAELVARIDKTLAIVRSFEPSKFAGAEERPITLRTPRGDLNFVGKDYLFNFVLPNVFFHTTTTYNILRHNGVELGKRDFLGAI